MRSNVLYTTRRDAYWLIVAYSGKSTGSKFACILALSYFAVHLYRAALTNKISIFAPGR
ncbi:hypothetical protein SAMN05216315_12054 [Nitrosospira sp. Nsp18]|nr:hypothetical protein SAMN05216315_12054 [Nitrosospira sp. Nsp18]